MPAKMKSLPPWEKRNPRKQSKRLTPKAKASAKSRAKRAGRKYPNFIDNMRTARARREKRRHEPIHFQHKRQARAEPPPDNPDKGFEKPVLPPPAGDNPSANQGAELRPGVKKSSGDMTPQEMRRKGNWALRFYGRRASCLRS